MWAVQSCARLYKKTPEEIYEQFHGKRVGEDCPCGCGNKTVLPPVGRKPQNGGNAALSVAVECHGCGASKQFSLGGSHPKFLNCCRYGQESRQRRASRNAIREARERAGLTDHQLAATLDVLVVTVRDWERRGKRPLAKYVKKMAALFTWTLEQAFQNSWGECEGEPCTEHENCPAKKTLPGNPNARCMDFEIPCQACGKRIYLRGDHRTNHSRELHRKCVLPYVWQLVDQESQIAKRCTGFEKFGKIYFACAPNVEAQDTYQCLRCEGAQKLHDLRVEEVRGWFRRNRNHFTHGRARLDYLELTGFKEVMRKVKDGRTVEPFNRIWNLGMLRKLHKAAIKLADKYELPALRGTQHLRRGGRKGHGKCKVKKTSRAIGAFTRWLLEGKSPFHGYCVCGSPIVGESKSRKHNRCKWSETVVRAGVKKDVEVGKRRFAWAYLSRVVDWTQKEIESHYDVGEDAVKEGIELMIRELETAMKEGLVSRRYEPIVLMILGKSPHRDPQRFPDAQGCIDPNFAFPPRNRRSLEGSDHVRSRGSAGRFSSADLTA